MAMVPSITFSSSVSLIGADVVVFCMVLGLFLYGWVLGVRGGELTREKRNEGQKTDAVFFRWAPLLNF